MFFKNMYMYVIETSTAAVPQPHLEDLPRPFEGKVFPPLSLSPKSKFWV